MSNGTALITGASSGIGEALARQFADHGFDLVITARREDRLAALAEDLSNLVAVEVVACDLSNRKGVTQLLQSLAGKQIDVLVNNAGIAYNGEFTDQSTSQIDGVLELNIHALTNLTHVLLPGMIKRGAGRILNVASVAAFQPVPSLAIYAASKAYVLSLSESLSEELRGTGIFVTALCPGMTKTDMLDDVQGFDVPPMLTSSAAEVARDGYHALMQGEVIRIPGLANQAAVTWAKHQPRWLVRGLGGLLSRLNPRG